jgi:hypothetical protein
MVIALVIGCAADNRNCQHPACKTPWWRDFRGPTAVHSLAHAWHKMSLDWTKPKLTRGSMRAG